MNQPPVIAIVGRPNVGKSTFFNRMLSTRKAIVDPIEGITRDRIYGTMDWTGFPLTFIDTGGYIPEDLDIFNAATRRQAQMAIQEADLILLMVDGRVDPTSSDLTLAQFVRETGKPSILVVNKCDTLAMDEFIHRFHELGFSNIQSISSQHGRMTGDLLDRIVDILNLEPSAAASEGTAAERMNLAIVGMPNVGKSSLVNALLQREQTMVTEVAGTTRDAIDTPLRWYGRDITIVDTAGLRKKNRVSDSIEYYSNVRTIQSIERAAVVIVVVDAHKGFGRQDKTIVDQVISNNKGLVIVVNKWDLITKDSNTVQEFSETISGQFKSLNHYPMLFISAKTAQRVSKVLDIAWNVYQARQQHFKTTRLNEWLKRATNENPPPAVNGKLIRIKYVTQITTAPILFGLFCNYPELIPAAYKRYLENSLRAAFPLSGVPVTLSFRKK